MGEIKLDDSNNKLVITIDNDVFLSYFRQCVLNGTKGRIELSLFNGELVNVAGKFQKYKGVDTWTHKNLRLK